MQEKTGTQAMGPASIPNVRDKVLRMDGEQAPIAKAAAQGEEQYIFANAEVDIGDGHPLPALQFVRMRPNRIAMYAEVARRKRIMLTICPAGWRPGR